MKKYKIIFLTGKRGGYDAMLPLLEYLNKKKFINLKIIVTDQHTKKKFGNTIEIIKKDFSRSILKIIRSTQSSDTAHERSNSISNLIKNLSEYFNNNNFDLIMLYGDRAESLAAAVVANNFNIPICHFQGGDLSGNIDEKFRHAISKLSNLHFTSNEISRKRLIKMGENPKNCYNFGDSHIDSLRNALKNHQSFDLIKKKYKLSSDYIVLLFHPDGTSKRKNFDYSKIIFQSIEKIKKQTIVIYPCTDIGYEGIIKSIALSKKKNKNISVYKNIKYNDFIQILKNADFLIGNSSSGIIESAYLDLPVINLGNRQKNRLSNDNIINSDINKKKILNSIKKIETKKFKSKMKRLKKYYGNGLSYIKTGKKIISSIERITHFKNFHE